MAIAPEPTGRRPTYADIEALPDGVNGEILGGELYASPRPAQPHVRASSALGALLGPPFDLGIGGPGGWWIDDEPELSLAVDPDFDPVIPDLAGWRVATLPDHSGASPQFHTTPDWVCEILSPSTARRDRVLKVPFYARAGVGHLWLIDPLAATLEVFRLDGPGWRLVLSAGADAAVRAEPFEAVELQLAYLWRNTKVPARPE